MSDSRVCQYCQSCTEGTTNNPTTTVNNKAVGQESNINWGGVIGKALILGGTVVALPCVGLTLAGFGTAGIVGGSLAAATQSAIGNVAAGSLFATLQSFGATAVFANGAAAGGAAAAAGAATVATTVALQNKHNKDGKTASGHINNGPEGGAMQTTFLSRFCPHCGRELIKKVTAGPSKL